ncbi:hypothetical protein BD413DRAFT_480427 [Trametes elegans]|nr:hypothetical protein BD413DRAFT_480427 [Trametes elegans]
MSYNLTVNINNDDFKALKDQGYKLCIAKRVNGTFDTVWQGETFFPHNTFHWTSRYEVFGTQTFEDGALVTSTTDAQEIKFGQTAILNSYGNMGEAGGTPNSSGTFSVNNEYGAMNIGVNGYMNGAFAPIFVSPKRTLTGPIHLTPVESVLVWFDLTHTTSTIIIGAISNSIEVDFTGGHTHRAVTYASAPDRAGTGIWRLDGQLRLAATFHPDTRRFTVDRPSVALLQKVTQLSLAAGAPRPRLAAAWGGADSNIVRACLAFAEAGAVREFERYAKEVRPEGLGVWEVKAAGDVVEVRMAAARRGGRDHQAPPPLQQLSCKCLGMLGGWSGPRYTKLTFEDVKPDCEFASLYPGCNVSSLIVLFTV